MKSQIDELMANLGAQKEKLSQQKMEHETEVSTFPSALHNVHFGNYVYLPTEQAETYLKSCVLINYLTYICLCLFGWKVNMILKETVTFKL